MNDRVDDQEPDLSSQPTKRTYVAPQLVVYGNVAKLTQTGGISVKDMGNMKRANT